MVACVLSLGCGLPGVFSFSESFGSTEWAQALERVTTDAEHKAQTFESQLQLLGPYHRFSANNGPERDGLSRLIEPGVIIAHTKAYIDGVQVSQGVDVCIKSLDIREGVSSLEHLMHPAGDTFRPHLPPLTETFVMRKEPWELVKRARLETREFNEMGIHKMLLVAGIGGCGETQLMVKFVNVHAAEFSSWFFIDGNGKDRIGVDTIRNVRSLGVEDAQRAFDECLLSLSNSQNNRPQLLLCDIIDDSKLDFRKLDFLPLSPRDSSYKVDNTSRNRIIGKFHSELGLYLDIMSINEAIVLLSYSSVPATAQGRKDVQDHAQCLGYLPIALQQARSCMQQMGCTIKAYLARLSSNQSKLLGRKIKQKLGMKLIAMYASFKFSFLRLSLCAQRLLRLLAYFHWSGFPLDLITLASKYHFSGYKRRPLDYGDEFYYGKQMLEEIFHRDGEWDVTNLDAMLLSLKKCSLVTVVSGVDTLLLQMHPLVHGWLRSCTPKPQKDVYQSAAVILLALGAHGGDTSIMQYLSSHVMHMSPLWDHLHVNNVVAFADILQQNGEFQHALKLQEMVVRELRKLLDIDDINLTISLWELASILRSCGRLNEAQYLQEDVLKTCMRVFGDRHLNTLKASVNLAVTYKALGRLADAKKIETEVLDISKEVLGERHSYTLQVSVNLAGTYRSTGQLKDAAGILVEAVKIRKETLGERHPDTLYAFSNLAAVYYDLGRLKEAAAIDSEVLHRTKEVLGERHPDTLRVSVSLANTYRDLGRLKEAAMIQFEALKTSKEILGEIHPTTLNMASHLAYTYRDLGRLKEAATIYIQALKMTKEVLGERHPDTLNMTSCLAIVYCDLGQLTQAELLQDKLVKIYKETLGDQHPETVDGFHRLAVTYREQGRLQDALALQTEVWKSRKEIQGNNHPYTILALSDLASVLHQMGHLTEAEPLAIEVLWHRVDILGAQHHDTLTASSNLAAIYCDLRRLEEAEALQLEVVTSIRETLGNQHFKTTRAMLVLAKIYQSQTREDEALELLSTAERIISEYLGVTHPQYLECLSIRAEIESIRSSLDEMEEGRTQVPV